jgi:hypothetical protein
MAPHLLSWACLLHWRQQPNVGWIDNVAHCGYRTARFALSQIQEFMTYKLKRIRKKEVLAYV